MSAISHLNKKFCGGCDKRMDKVDKRHIYEIKDDDIDMICRVRLQNQKALVRIIRGNDLLCNYCTLKLNKIRNISETGNLTQVDTDILFTASSSSTPLASSPISKRVAPNFPSSSSGESSEPSAPSSPHLNVSLEDIEVEEIEREEETEQTVILEIPSTVKSHSHCIICPHEKTNIRKVTEEVQIDFLIRTGIWISDHSRLCVGHFNDDNTIKKDYEELIMTHCETSKWKGKEVTSLINNLRNTALRKHPNLFEKIDDINDLNCKNMTGLSIQQFKTLLEAIPSLKKLPQRIPSVMLAVYLFRMKNAAPLKLISTLFGIESFQRVARMVNETRKCLTNDIASKFIGLNNAKREEMIRSHTTIISKTILKSPNSLITIWDGTYAYCQKSSNYLVQKKLWSDQKKRPLCKPFIGITTDGYYLDVFDVYDATSNDASIMKDLLAKESFSNYFNKGDIFVVDRGFRDAISKIEEHGFKAEMPAFIPPKEKQLTCKEANRSRKVTKIRYAVEVAIGKLKSHFRFFDKVIQNKNLPQVHEDLRISAAILNLFFIPILSDVENEEMISKKYLKEKIHLIL